MPSRSRVLSQRVSKALRPQVYHLASFSLESQSRKHAVTTSLAATRLTRCPAAPPAPVSPGPQADPAPQPLAAPPRAPAASWPAPPQLPRGWCSAAGWPVGRCKAERGGGYCGFRACIRHIRYPDPVQRRQQSRHSTRATWAKFRRSKAALAPPHHCRPHPPAQCPPAPQGGRTAVPGT